MARSASAMAWSCCWCLGHAIMVGRFEAEDVVAGCISCTLIHYRIPNERHKSAHRTGESPLSYACIFPLVKENFT